MELIIVESPTKAKTISRFLGATYRVTSSYGHIRDLPKSKLGIDVATHFTPTYIIPPKAKEVVASLKKEAHAASRVILATDEDREGEAIAWHLVQALGLNHNANATNRKANATNEKGDSLHADNAFVDSHYVQRIVFHEITKGAIEEALRNPRAIDLKLVDAQQARRVLDRLVGYELSPFLWRKIRYGLSAGRVQSVAVRLIVEREREIQKFAREEYWTIEAEFGKRGVKPFPARLVSFKNTALPKMGIRNEAQARRIAEEAREGPHRVLSVTKKDISRNPAAPFTTSTFQQEASRKLGFSAKQTMTIAQRLYEEGAITYMRTDSVNLAESALTQAKKVIGEEFGASYTLPEPRRYATKSKGAQEAHEAIRPTDISKFRYIDISSSHDRGAQRLYDLIWKRTIASQMQSARFEQTSADLGLEGHHSFRASGQVVKFDGFIRAYTEGRDEPEEEIEGVLPELREGDALALASIEPRQHFTEPPPRYTDATLVKALEAEGIGRPSTYAPTLTTIQDRGYVEKKEKAYFPTDIGMLVNDLLVEHFPEIVDVHFTSHIEEELDDIAEGKIPWEKVCEEFYTPFKKRLTEKEETVLKQVEVSDTPCPHCGKPMLIKFGRMGKFLACPEPESKVTLPMPEEAAKIKELEEKTKDERCPLCGKEMQVKRGRFGFFLGCVDYPKCKGVAKIWNKTGFKCPRCQEQATRNKEQGIKETNPMSHVPVSMSLIGDIVEKKGRGRRVPFYACTRYPDCTFIMNKKPESQAELDAGFEAWKNKPPATAKPVRPKGGVSADKPISPKTERKPRKKTEA
ncbi:MAG: type I DNA topoisomerase [Candidatus Liptonbacteria bacterium]|nr:type I DNA topoisomerase [Candidatus Liptonbacteria bacterium]